MTSQKPILEDLASAIRFGAAYDAPLYAFLNRTVAEDSEHPWENADGTAGSNFTQVFIRPVDMSRATQRGRTLTENQLEYQIMKSVLEVALDIERALLLGTIHQEIDSGVRDMKGLDSFITSEVDDENGTLTASEFETFLHGIWNNGGNPDILLCDGLFFSVIHEWNVGSLQVGPSDRIGGVRVTQWVSPFGLFTILPDRQVTTGTCYALTSSSLGLAVGDDIHYQELSRTSDGTKGQVVAEVTLECANEQFHGRQYGVTGSA